MEIEPTPTSAPRCALVVPASNESMVAKALASAADEVVLDLEDAVAASAKASARATVAAVVRGELGHPERRIAVRVNQIGTPWCHQDVLAVVHAAGETARPVTLVVPKVESAGDVGFVDRLLRGALAGRSVPPAIAVDVLVETAAALRDLPDILAASDRIRAVVIGYADLAADLGRDVGADPTLWDGVRQGVVTAARAAGRLLVDGPWLGTTADEAFLADRERARALGFDGTWVIHPAQIEAATRLHTPSADRVDWAERVLARLVESVVAGHGAVSLDGEMLDEAVAVRARAVLARAEAERVGAER